MFPALDSDLAAQVASLGTLMGTGIITLTALSSAPGRLSLRPSPPLLHRALDAAVVHARWQRGRGRGRCRGHENPHAHRPCET